MYKWNNILQLNSVYHQQIGNEKSMHPICAEKALKKNTTTFPDKNLQLETDENFLNLIEAKYDKPTANIIFNDETLNIFPQIRDQAMVPKSFSQCGKKKVNKRQPDQMT